MPSIHNPATGYDSSILPPPAEHLKTSSNLCSYVKILRKLPPNHLKSFFSTTMTFLLLKAKKHGDLTLDVSEDSNLNPSVWQLHICVVPKGFLAIEAISSGNEMIWAIKSDLLSDDGAWKGHDSRSLSRGRCGQLTTWALNFFLCFCFCPAPFYR
ncbi:hypothetical protein CEXT_360521 [Caerostris extrusa]|uniref:Uncharacterized protein n=1 Tax=Caerostris extrusa TaxID=172846 RepID=A0AAV4NGZ7_CAEEX|nr:hypothetical protein CEXT_360521 [Caerostris extrusa]